MYSNGNEFSSARDMEGEENPRDQTVKTGENNNSRKRRFEGSVCKSSHWRCSVKKRALKNFANFTGKHLCWSLLFIKLQAFKALLKRDSNTGVFLRNVQNF